METRVRMRLMGLGRAKEVKPLDEASAVQLGADMLGEGIIFGVSAGIIAWEYLRQIRKDAAKENTQNDRLSVLEGHVQDLGLTIEQQSAEIRELNRLILQLPDKTDKKLPRKIFDSKSGLSVTVDSSWQNW